MTTLVVRSCGSLNQLEAARSEFARDEYAYTSIYAVYTQNMQRKTMDGN